MTLQEGDLLWTPSQAVIEQANLTAYMRWLAENHDLTFDDYDALWAWSVADLPTFWATVRDYCGVVMAEPAEAVLASRKMPGATWFDGARLNYAENIFAHRTEERPMLLYGAEDQPLRELSWAEAYEQVRRMAAALRAMGVEKGDRVVAFLPNIPQAVIAMLATTSLGAIWSSCSPDFGARSVLDRFTQIEPKVLIAVDGYQYAGRDFDRRAVLADLQAGLPTLQHTILIPYGEPELSGLADTSLWVDVLSDVEPPAELQYEHVPFDHPLWVLYSSGTTGKPKPIVHGHGGIVLEHAKALTFHNDIKPGDRFFWYSSTGWMMWNYLVGSLMAGATAVLYDGSPGYPDLNGLFAFAEASGLTYFGTSAAFISACMKAGITPGADYDLSAIRAVGSTGSPLSVDGFGWVYEHINGSLALESLSGGTDLCTAFVGGARIKPIYAGVIQGASLGAKVQAYDQTGEPVVGEVGELVITEPMPSMPVMFWGDADMTRYTSAYFEMYPGIWRHGDWIKFLPNGGCIIYGRSDATINRHGIRMGTAEIYQAVQSLPDVLDSLVVDLEGLEGESYMPLFVVLREGATLDDALIGRINAVLRAEVSPRHTPDEVVAIDEVPYTLSGKKMEVPIRRILLGQPVEKAANPGAMRNPGSLQFFIDFAERRG